VTLFKNKDIQDELLCLEGHLFLFNKLNNSYRKSILGFIFVFQKLEMAILFFVISAIIRT